MITLQKTVTYLGDINQSPLNEVTLRFLCPVFGYSMSNVDERHVGMLARTGSFTVFREVTSVENVDITHELNNVDYNVALPTRNLIGKQSDVVRNFIIYTYQSYAKQNANVDDISVTVPVQFVANQNIPIGSSSLEALYFIRGMEPAEDRLRPMGTWTFNLFAIADTPSPDLAELVAFLEKNIILVNKEVYNRILPEFKQLSATTSDLALLFIIQRLIEAADVASVQSLAFNDDVITALSTILSSQEIENPEPVIEFIKSHFADLFDFPILIPEIKTLAVAGTFHVKTQDDVEITKDDLFFYHMSLEYLCQTAPNTDKLQVIRYDWQAGQEPHDNSVPFSFSNASPVILNTVRGLIRVIVKGIDGSVLWTKEYQPDDLQLQELFIEVALQRPNALQVMRNGEVKDGKKLRGQVLELSKKCSLKDLTIVVQAKKEGDQLWRVVAATNTDASGNFSMAYPYGEYTKAQAIVSLTPDSCQIAPVYVPPIRARMYQ